MMSSNILPNSHSCQYTQIKIQFLPPKGDQNTQSSTVPNRTLGKGMLEAFTKGVHSLGGGGETSSGIQVCYGQSITKLTETLK